MARKRLTGVRLTEGAAREGWQLADVERVVSLEDGKTFPQEQARELVARAVNAGEDYYVRGPDGAEVRVKAVLRHGKYYLTAPGGNGQPDLLLGLPALGRA
jgi:hypothetical protein